MVHILRNDTYSAIFLATNPEVISKATLQTTLSWLGPSSMDGRESHILEEYPAMTRLDG